MILERIIQSKIWCLNIDPSLMLKVIIKPSSSAVDIFAFLNDKV